MNNQNYNFIITKAINAYENSMETELDLAALLTRNPIAHKWKVTYAIYVIRETVYWRIVDIVKQANHLGQNNMIVGARILSRAAIETLSTLVYLNEKMLDVVSNKIAFGDFSETIRKIFMGSRTEKGLPETINVLTMIEKCDKKHTGILKIYKDLCETCHPSYVGLTDGYSKFNPKKYITSFGNFWLEKHGNIHEIALFLCLQIFENEYNEDWLKSFESLEKWLVNNDKELEQKRQEIKDNENVV